jgi:hypothetical protein
MGKERRDHIDDDDARVLLQLVDENVAFEARQRDSRHAALLEIADRVEYAQLVLRRTRNRWMSDKPLGGQGTLDDNIERLKLSRGSIRSMQFTQHVDARETRGAADHAERTPSRHRRCIHSPSLDAFIGSAYWQRIAHTFGALHRFLFCGAAQNINPNGDLCRLNKTAGRYIRNKDCLIRTH